MFFCCLPRPLLLRSACLKPLFFEMRFQDPRFRPIPDRANVVISKGALDFVCVAPFRWQMKGCVFKKGCVRPGICSGLKPLLQGSVGHPMNCAAACKYVKRKAEPGGLLRFRGVKPTQRRVTRRVAAEMVPTACSARAPRGVCFRASTVSNSNEIPL